MSKPSTYSRKDNTPLDSLLNITNIFEKTSGDLDGHHGTWVSNNLMNPSCNSKKRVTDAVLRASNGLRNQVGGVP